MYADYTMTHNVSLRKPLGVDNKDALRSPSERRRQKRPRKRELCRTRKERDRTRGVAALSTMLPVGIEPTLGD